MTDTPDKIRFQPGSVVATMGALQIATEEQIKAILDRHLRGDWGDLDEHDRKANEAALRDGDRLFSSYQITPDTKLWIVTEANRSTTTVMLPEDY